MEGFIQEPLFIYGSTCTASLVGAAIFFCGLARLQDGFRASGIALVIAGACLPPLVIAGLASLASLALMV